MLETEAKVGKGKATSTKQVLAKERVPLTVPMIPLEDESGESLVLGFRSSMLTMSDKGGVATGSGLGTDFIILEWGDRRAVVRGSELLRAWVATFSPEEAANFPEQCKGLS